MKPLVERYLGGLPVDAAGRRRGRTSASTPPDGRRREARRQGHRAEEPDARIVVHRAVPVQPGAARRDPRDGATCSRPAARDRCARTSAAPTACRRQPSYAKFPRQEYTRLDRLRQQPGSHRGAREERLRARSSCSRPTGPTDKQVADVKETLAARPRDQQQAERLSCSPNISSRYQYRRTSPRALRPGGLLQEADRRDDPGGGADVSRHEQLREGDAVPRKEGVAEISSSSRWPSHVERTRRSG